MGDKDFDSHWVDEIAARGGLRDLIVDGISDVLMLVEAGTYEILEVNQAFLSTYGVARAEVVGWPCYAVTHRVDRPCHNVDPGCVCPVAEAVRTGRPATVEHRHVDAAGREVPVEGTAFPVPDGAGGVSRVIHISRDVSERKRHETEQLEKAKLTAILELAGGASHELNQPLTVVLIGLRYLAERLPTGSSEHDMTLKALAEAERLLTVSRRLGQVTRYATTDYVNGARILDLGETSADGERPKGC